MMSIACIVGSEDSEGWYVYWSTSEVINYIYTTYRKNTFACDYLVRNDTDDSWQDLQGSKK